MGVVEVLQSVPVEVWGLGGSGFAAVAIGVIKFIETIKKKFDCQAESVLKRTAEVMAMVTVEQVDSGISSVRYLRNDQIAIAKKYLLEYAEQVLQSVDSAVDGFMGSIEDHDLHELVKSLWMQSVRDTFITDVLDFFICIIQQNGFADWEEREFRDFSRSEIAFGKFGKTGAFGAFTGGVRRKFNHAGLRARADWIESNIDRKGVSDVCENIMIECRNRSIKYKHDRKEAQTGLSEKIKRDLTALK